MLSEINQATVAFYLSNQIALPQLPSRIYEVIKVKVNAVVNV